MAPTSYPQGPPSYQAIPTSPKNSPAQEPLLGQSSRAGGGAGGIFDQPDEGDLPDDFKYGVTVYESAPEVRNAFIRKVYSILFVQLLGTCIVGGVMAQTHASAWIQNHIWALYIPMFGAIANLLFLWFKRHSHPLNFILLGTFTVMESLTLGFVVGFYDQIVILQAMIITLGVFLGLTLFTFQSKYDFTGMGTYLYGGLLVLLMTGIVGIFIPFNQTWDLIYAVGGTLLFSGYVVYDTFIITKKLSPDEAIMGAISLYLDFINLFLSILRLLNNVEER
ncbi:hypothetical protein FRC02_002542 [Tulasnella sp. 418]|nr:hypothetical protein FRC02_002542 [Tulasnella sp. 418]